MRTRTLFVVLFSTLIMVSPWLAGCGGSQQAERATDSDDTQQAGQRTEEGASTNGGSSESATEQIEGPAAEPQPVAPPSTRSTSRSTETLQPQPIAALPKSRPVEVGTARAPRPRQLAQKRHASKSAAQPTGPTSPSPSAEPSKLTQLDQLLGDIKPQAADPSDTRVGASAVVSEPSESMSPRMATASREPVEEAAPPQEPTVSAAPLATERPTTPPSEKGTMVTVFYGTDRKATGGTATGLLTKIPWGYLTAASGGITLLLLLILCFARRSKFVRTATVVSLVATIALGACMFQIPRNTKPMTANTSLQYGNERGDLVMGTCEVSIPKNHEVGELESPSIMRLEFNEDPEKHVVLMGVKSLEADTFFNKLNERIDKSDRKEAFVFIHGYNVTFENAARRTAQLAHDLHFDGAPIFYSWPSQGGLLQYTVDETNVVWTVPHLREFLLGVAEKTKAQRVHLIAHSMGNRALTSALARLSQERHGDRPLFHEVLLTAPDIDAEVFRRDIAPAIVKTASRVTLYASSHDTALAASRKVHGGYPRAGESGENLVVIPGIDTIDVSAVDTSLMGHSYYGDSDSVLVDMAQLLHDEKPPNLRDRLRTMSLGTLRYWVFLAKQMGRRPDNSEL